MKILTRIFIFEFLALFLGLRAGIALWHYSQPPKDSWYITPWAFTCLFIGILIGVGFAFSVWRLMMRSRNIRVRP